MTKRIGVLYSIVGHIITEFNDSFRALMHYLTRRYGRGQRLLTCSGHIDQWIRGIDTGKVQVHKMKYKISTRYLGCMVVTLTLDEVIVEFWEVNSDVTVETSGPNVLTTVDQMVEFI